MGWREEVLERIRRLPTQFTLPDVYRFVPELHRLHPENQHVEERIRATLQDLRKEGAIRFVDQRGTYLRLVDADTTISDVLAIPEGTLTTRSDLAQLMGYDSDQALRRGMYKPRSGPLQNHLFLFHDEKGNPYGDVHEGNRIRYVGQGMEGDQELSSYNRYLAEHFSRGLKVHYFVQPRSEPGKVRYRGQVVLESVNRVFRAEEGRSVLEFTLVPALVEGKTVDAQSVYGQMVSEILGVERRAGYVARKRVPTLAVRIARDAAFRDLLLEAYADSCAVCETPLRSEAGNELQGAHIVPVSQDGPDELPNGLSLCVRHHWAFDAGVFTVNDDLTVDLLSRHGDPHGEIEPGSPLLQPRYSWQRPDPFYLQHHRRTWQNLA